MVRGVQRRLILSYSAVIAVTLLLFGPVLYLAYARQLTTASDVALRLTAQRQAALALDTTGLSIGRNPHFKAPPALADRDVFYLLLRPDGRVQANPTRVVHAGLPDRAAAHSAARARHGVFSTLHTADAGDIRLYTAVLMRAGRIVALLQAGRSVLPLDAAQRSLLYFLLGLGGAALLVTAAGGVLLTRQAMQPIQAAFAAQRTFIAEASHELRTPLTLIRTNAEVLVQAGAVSTDEDRVLIADIVAEAEHMGRLVADLLTLARLDAGVLPLQQGPVALDTLAVACVRQMARMAERSGIDVSVSAPAPVVVPGDAGRLEQVLLILLDNAVTYNKPEGSVVVAVRADATHAVVTVADTGRGIPADDLPHVFRRFHRGRSSNAVTEGSGLGLAIAAGIAQAHQGRLTVHSTPGQGTTITLRLPRAGRLLRAAAIRHDTGVGRRPD